MKPVIYVAERCHQCGMVKDFVDDSGVSTDIHNVDTSDAKPPKDVFVYPAMFLGEELLLMAKTLLITTRTI